VARLFDDSLRFAASEMIRRILGLAHVADLDDIADPDTRALCEARALRAARELLINHRKYTGIASAIAMMREERARSAP
jgi:5-methylthioribose kinase